MQTPTTATRSVVVGLLLGAVSAGSLIAFSLFAGEADNPTGATVAATGLDADVPPVVLGKRIAAGGSPRPTPEASGDVPPPPGTSEVAVVADTVLGKRLRQEGRDERDKSTDKRPEPSDKRDKGIVRGKTLAKRPSDGSVAKSKCRPCKSKRAHSPNGNAYGHHKNRSSLGSPGLARGHEKSGSAASPGKSSSGTSSPGNSSNAGNSSPGNSGSAGNSSPGNSGSPGNGKAKGKK